MPLDAICLTAVRLELSGRITGMKIDKVTQPERDCVVLSLRGAGAGENCRLLICAGSGDARIHLTEHRFENPAAPPMFCMLLRKHLTGGRILSVNQPPGERLIELVISAPDAMGVQSEKRLIAELMGRAANIILTDEAGIITDCLRRVGGELSDKRSVLPGLLYRLPPAQEGKVYPPDVTPEQWAEFYDSARGKSSDKWLLDTFFALSPLICREISYRAYGETDYRNDTADGGCKLKAAFFEFCDSIRAERFEPYLLTDSTGEPRDFSYTAITQYEDAYRLVRAENFSELLDGFYTRASQRARVGRRASEMTKTIKNARDRLVRKLAAQRTELEKTAQRDYLRECGDLIKANMHNIKKGDSVLLAEDYYAGEEGAVRKITLDEQKSPQQNAAKYYKDYAKAKNAQIFLTEQLRLGESELVYLESVLEELALAEGESDLAEIRQELKETGYIKKRRQDKKETKKSAPMRFISGAGIEIFAGKNNAQNDLLTLKTAGRNDIWLHAKNIHGSHVIISCGAGDADEKTLGEAAAIAAYYSSARSDGKVPVDYCRVRHVKKPSGGRPGAVIYTDYKTIIAAPDERLVDSIRVK